MIISLFYILYLISTMLKNNIVFDVLLKYFSGASSKRILAKNENKNNVMIYNRHYKVYLKIFMRTDFTWVQSWYQKYFLV